LKQFHEALLQAIVGAGAAGLITARELRKMGHQVTVFEQTNSIGGVWSYTDEVEDDILGTDPDRKKVHGSMYANLRTNLPREVMGVADFPFDDQFPGSRDFRRYCSHEEVFRYLVAYAEQYSVNQSIKLNAKVIDLKPLDDGSGSWPKWQVKVSMENAVEKSSTFDACVICNGHYSKPRVPQWPGQEEFPGIQMHSHNYRRPEKFKGKRVLVVGAAFSGSDISQELLEYGAKAVYLSGRSWEDLAKGQMLENSREVLRVNNIERLHEDGSVSFIDGTRVDDVDVIMYATGYLYEFPFLSNVPDAPSVKDNRVSVLYKHVFPPRLGPTLSFVGLPWKVVPFPQFQLQAQWIGACLNGSVQLPCADDMTQDALQWYQILDRQGIETRYTHRMSPDLQAEYNTWLAETSQVSQAGWPDWRKELYLVSGMNRRQHGTTFREHDLEQLGAAHAIEQFRQEAKQVRQSLISPYTAMSNAS